MAGQYTIEVTNDNFDEQVAQSDIPVVVDFWAPWCAPCRMIAPMLDQLAEKHNGVVAVGKCNVDENPALAQRYRITGIPALIAYKNGEEVSRIVGANPKKIDSVFTELAG